MYHHRKLRTFPSCWVNTNMSEQLYKFYWLILLIEYKYVCQKLLTLGIPINALVRLFLRYLCLWALLDVLILNHICPGLKRTPGALIHLFPCTNDESLIFGCDLVYLSLFFSSQTTHKYTFSKVNETKTLVVLSLIVSLHRQVRSNLSKKRYTFSIINIRTSDSEFKMRLCLELNIATKNGGDKFLAIKNIKSKNDIFDLEKKHNKKPIKMKIMIS